MNWTLLDQLPFLAGLSPITLVGCGVLAIALVLYGLTQMPEFLIVMFTSALYALMPFLRS